MHLIISDGLVVRAREIRPQINHQRETVCHMSTISEWNLISFTSIENTNIHHNFGCTQNAKTNLPYSLHGVEEIISRVHFVFIASTNYTTSQTVNRMCLE